MHRKVPLYILLLAVSALAQTARYPGAVATDQDLLKAVDNAFSQLAAPIPDAAALTVSVNSGASFAGRTHFSVTVGGEQMLICSVSGNTLNVCPSGRGFAGTTAAAHPAGVAVRGNITAWHHNALAEEVKAIEGALGPNLENVVSSSSFTSLNVQAAPGQVDNVLSVKNESGANLLTQTAAGIFAVTVPGGGNYSTVASFGNGTNNTTIAPTGITAPYGTFGTNIMVPNIYGSQGVNPGTLTLYGGSAAGSSVVINSNSRFGVGVSPAYNLDVLGQGRFQQDGASLQPTLYLANAQTPAAGVGSALYYLANAGATTGIVASRLDADNTNAAYMSFYTRTAGAITEKARLTSTGRLGIGATNVLGTLHLSATAPISYFSESGAGADEKNWQMAASSGQLQFSARNDASTAGNDWMRVDRTGATVDSVSFPNGNVLVGTSTDDGSGAKLQVAGGLHTTAYSEFQRDGAGIQMALALRNNQTAAAGVGPNLGFLASGGTTVGQIAARLDGSDTTAAYMPFYTRGSNTLSERMRITSGGNVLIGTSTDDALNKLQVAGSAKATLFQCNSANGTGDRPVEALTTNDVLRWRMGLSATESGSNAGSDYAIWSYADDGSYIGQPFRIDRSTGNVLLSSGADDGVNKLQVNGTISATGINVPKQINFAVTDPNTALPASSAWVWSPEYAAVTITQVRCVADTSDAVVQIRKATTDILSANLTCGNGSWTATTSFSDASIPQNWAVGYRIVSGTAKSITFSIRYTGN